MNCNEYWSAKILVFLFQEAILFKWKCFEDESTFYFPPRIKLFHPAPHKVCQSRKSKFLCSPLFVEFQLLLLLWLLLPFSLLMSCQFVTSLLWESLFPSLKLCRVVVWREASLTLFLPAVFFHYFIARQSFWKTSCWWMEVEIEHNNFFGVWRSVM